MTAFWKIYVYVYFNLGITITLCCQVCGDNSVVNGGFETLVPPCDSNYIFLINGAFNNKCLTGWQAAWATPSVCDFGPRSGKNFACFGANNEGMFQDIGVLNEKCMYELQFYYKKISGSNGNMGVYVANGLVNQSTSNTGSMPLTINPDWDLITIQSANSGFWNQYVHKNLFVKNQQNNQLLFILSGDIDIGIDDVVLTPRSATTSFTYSTLPSGSIAFSGMIQDAPPNYEVVSWSWEFGDGTFSSGQFPTHTFVSCNDFTVCLTTIDACGCSQVFCETLKIQSSSVITNYSFLESCDLEDVGIDTFYFQNQQGCDSVDYRTTTYVPLDTIFKYIYTCDSTSIGKSIEELPGPNCDTIQITFKVLGSPVYKETFVSCDSIGPNADTLIVTSSTGCDSLYIREYVYTQLDAEVVSQDESCFGDSDGFVQFINGQGGKPPYRYRINEDPWQDSAIFNALKPGVYTPMLEDVNGCSRSFNDVVIQKGSNFFVDLGSDISVNVGEVVTIKLQSMEWPSKIEWTSVDSLSCKSCPEVTLGPLTTDQTIYVTASDSIGCSKEDSLRVFVNDIEANDIYIPNCFSPNFDGINDWFIILSKNNLNRIKVLRVHDRWGNLVFSETFISNSNTTQGWDGTFNGKPCEPGVYVYFVEVESFSGKILQLKGDITLIK